MVCSGEGSGATQGNRKQDSCSWAKDGLGFLYTAAWFFLHGFRSYFQEHWESKKVRTCADIFTVPNSLLQLLLLNICIEAFDYLANDMLMAGCLRREVIGRGRTVWRCMKACTSCLLEISSRPLICFLILSRLSQLMKSSRMTPSYFTQSLPASYHWIEFPWNRR